jgi:threonine aldolase
MIDLRSDTLTQPSKAMRRAMAAAEVGDDVFGEDPTVQRLEDFAAALIGKESALFLPSGTMANLVAFLAQTKPGDSVILGAESHPYRFEAANLARFGGLLTRTPPDIHGKIDPAGVMANLTAANDDHFSPTTIVSIENTTNLGGGGCYSAEEAAAIGRVCDGDGLRLHCDGARLFNAATALGVEPEQLAKPCDSVSFCLSKGLGAPMGSLLCGDSATIREARRVRKQLGGGMRQAGIAGAAGLYALEHHLVDLKEDHRRAAEFRSALEEAGIRFPRPSPTNIVMVTSKDARSDVATLEKRGVRVLAMNDETIRVVFHRDITDSDTARAMDAFLQVLAPA